MNKAASDSTDIDKAGCLAPILCFVAIEGGIVLTAWALHGALVGAGPPDRRLMALAAAGVLIVVVAPLAGFRAFGARPRVTWRQVAAALPDFALAGWFVLGWAAPHVIGTQAAALLPGLMVLEFIIIHASVGLVAFPRQMAGRTHGDRWWKTPRAMTVWLLLMYSVGAAGISAAVRSAWLFIGFWMLIGNKFLDDWLSPAAAADERARRHMARWATAALLYLLLAFGSVLIPVPRLGALSASDGDGLWEQNPEQAVAMGAMYFILLAFCELYGGFNSVPATQTQDTIRSF